MFPLFFECTAKPCPVCFPKRAFLCAGRRSIKSAVLRSFTWRGAGLLFPACFSCAGQEKTVAMQMRLFRLNAPEQGFGRAASRHPSEVFYEKMPFLRL